MGSLKKQDDEDDYDLLESLEAQQLGQIANIPEKQLDQKQVVAEIERALEKIPARQREAFLLRYWEEMDVAETAAIMGCSQGSVKTHCSRAVHALSIILRSKGVTL